MQVVPILIGFGIAAAGIILIVFGVIRRNVSLQAGRGRWLKGIGVAALAAAGGWVGYTGAVVPPAKDFVLSATAGVPASFTFVPVIRMGGRVCVNWERELCQSLDRRLPDRHVSCVVNPKEIDGTFAQAILNRSFTVPVDTLLLRGDIRVSVATGSCTLAMSGVHDNITVPDFGFEGTFRCDPATVCQQGPAP